MRISNHKGQAQRAVCGKYLRDGHVAYKLDCLLQLTAASDGDVGEAFEIAVSEEEGREGLWRGRYTGSIQSHTLILGLVQLDFRLRSLKT